MPNGSPELQSTQFAPLDFDPADLQPTTPSHPTFIHPHSGRELPVDQAALALGEALGIFSDKPLPLPMPDTLPSPIVRMPLAETLPPTPRTSRTTFEAVCCAYTPRYWKLLGAGALLAITGGAITAVGQQHRIPQPGVHERPDTPPAKDTLEK